MPPPNTRKRKPIVVEISDSESEDDETSIASDSDDDFDEDDDESLSEGEDSDFVADDEVGDEDDSDRDCDSDEYDSGDENGESGIGEGTEVERCWRVVDRLETGQRNLDILKLEDCKAYLRKHSLRLSGSKSTCIKRVMEHWRIKDTDGEKLYPRASFTINCTGDVCKGDVVLFRQRVYDKFDKVKRSSKIIGKRTVAGRIVKESYGAAKQQHTFTVEVLWIKGQKVLPPLYPLLVKGRNLYRLKTFRQPWSNEAGRKQVLDEKHRRGAVARQIRQTRKTTKAGSSSHEHLSGARHAPKPHTKEQFKHAPKRRKQNNPPDKSRHHPSSVKSGAKQSEMARNAPAQVRSQRYANYAGESQHHPPGVMRHIPMTRNPSAQFQERVTHYHHPFPPRMPFHDNYDGLNTQHYPAISAQPHGNFASHHNRWNSSQVPRQPTFFHGSAAPSNTQFYWWRRP